MAAIGGGGEEEEEAKVYQEPDSNKRKLDEIQLAKQKAQEIAARLFNNAESKRSRFDESSETTSFSHVSSFSDVAQKPPGQSTTNTQSSFSVQPGSNYGFQGSSKRIDIPNAKVGVIIGKGGETIKYLQLQSGARIHITKDGDADPYSQTRDVEINGTSEQISRAEQLIKDVIAETDAGGSGSSAARGSNFVSPGGGGGDQFSMKVPNDKVAWIIGKGGETIKNIQSRSGARIQIIPLHLPPGDTSTERTVYINGTQEQIDSAKDLVNDVIAGNRVRNLSTATTYSQQGYGPPGNWGQPSMQQPSYGYTQPGAYPTAPTPYYSNYPPQPAAWDPSNPPAVQPPPQQNTGYNYYGQQTPAEGAAAQPNVSYPYGQAATTINSNYDQGYSQQSQSYGQDATVQNPQHDQQQQYATPGYGVPAASAQMDGTVPIQSYGTQTAPAYPVTYNHPQTVSPAGYGPSQTYAAQQAYDQTGYTQSGYGGQKPPQYQPPVQNPLPTSQAVYGQGGYPSQPAPVHSTYVQGATPPVYRQAQAQAQPTTYTEPLAYGSERNGDGNTNHSGYGSSPAVQEGAHPQS
ncbi:Far upstream element-binding protein [Thalictrum thalictroides]|uniref:Far upstream element-binding protein n=1 Tax=Thalictrum thalictroides TaxID=46969 RepID=A0A7J6URM7_THATH|nr:Far upstream element-binding protein [Thalictrum thalictroides]